MFLHTVALGARAHPALLEVETQEPISSILQGIASLWYFRCNTTYIHRYRTQYGISTYSRTKYVGVIGVYICIYIYVLHVLLLSNTHGQTPNEQI